MNKKVFIKKTKKEKNKNKNSKNTFNNQMYEYKFFEEFIANLKNHLPTSFFDYALNYEIPDYQTNFKTRSLTLLELLAINSDRVDDPSSWTRVSYTGNYKIDNLLNNYAYNYWKGTTIKYRKYVKQNFISILVNDENNVKMITRISELKDLLAMMITEMLKNNGKISIEHCSSEWLNIVTEHNHSLISRK